jgi:DNA-directed RNA polymerase sigma subunit (sigma70/sigma32)
MEKYLVEARLAFEAADRELVQAIMDARGGGMSLRAIADAAGVSHEKVRQILRG